MNTLEDRLRAYGSQLDQIAGDAIAPDLTSAVVVRAPRSSRSAWVVIATLSVASATFVSVALRRHDVESTEVGATRKPTSAKPRTSGDDSFRFPIAGESSFVDTFGAPRSLRRGGKQVGTDIFAAKGTEVFAMRSGIVTRIAYMSDDGQNWVEVGSAREIFRKTELPLPRAEVERKVTAMSSELQALVTITDPDRNWFAYYNVRLDDTIHVGEPIRVGQRLGVVGSPTPSNAALIPPHLRVEIHGSAGAINPYLVLDAARKGRVDYTGQELMQNELSVGLAVERRMNKLLNAARLAGFTLDAHGYRDPALQVKRRQKSCGTSLYDVYVKQSSKCRPPTAIPGNSAHERGRAVDFSVNGRGLTADDAAHKWLQTNAAKYEWVNPIADEPWHWEYVGAS